MKAKPVYKYTNTEHDINITVYHHRNKAQFLPFVLPERRYGKFSIVHKKVKRGAVLPVVSMRNALFMGLKVTNITLTHPMIVHVLQEHSGGMKDSEVVGTWMTSYPQEIEQMQRQLRHFHGRVLVGGLGLGIAVTILQNNPSVKEIVCVEKSGSVINLVSPHLSKRKLKLEGWDLFDWIPSAKRWGINLLFDFAFYDTWCGTGEYEFLKTVQPLRKLSKGLIRQENIECWNEEEMLGQVRMGLHGKIQLVNQGMIKREDVEKYCKKDKLAWPFLRDWLKNPVKGDQLTRAIDNYIWKLKRP